MTVLTSLTFVFCSCFLLNKKRMLHLLLTVDVILAL